MTDIPEVSASAALGIGDTRCVLWEGPLDIVFGAVARGQVRIIRAKRRGKVRMQVLIGRRGD